MRILITEEALQYGNGHWPSYVQDLATGFREAGDVVDILAHKEATQKVFDAVPGAIPWFSRNCRTDPRSQGLLGGIRHNIRFYKELREWLDSNAPYDWVLSLSSRPKHLLAFDLLSRLKRFSRTRFLVLFVLGFGKVPDHQPVGGRLEFRPGAANWFAKFCFYLLRGAVERRQVVLAAETRGMQGELERFSGLVASLYPHPVEMPAERRVAPADRRWKLVDREAAQPLEADGVPEEYASQSTGERGLIAENSPATSNSLPDTTAKPVVVVAPGFARHEKGSDLLQEAIKIFKSRPCGVSANLRPVRFVLQWQEDFPMPDGKIVQPDEDLRKSADVEYLKEILVGADYLNFLAGGDLVVLPYRKHSYSRRVSRVSVEAALLGKPIIYTAGTWSSEVAEMAGCGVEVSEESPEAIAQGLFFATERIAELRSKAMKGASAVRNFYSVHQFRNQLLKEAQ